MCPTVLVTYRSISGIPLSRVSFQGVIKNTVNAAAMCHPVERRTHKSMMIYRYPLYSLDLALCYYWLSLKVNVTIKCKCFELIQGIKSAMTTQLRTITKKTAWMWQEWWEKHVRNACVCGGGGSSESDMSSALVYFWNLNSHCIFHSNGGGKD